LSPSPDLGPHKEARLSTGTVRYRERGPADGPALVFVHGLLVNGDLWRKVVPWLERRFRCLLPDLPLGGHALPMPPDADLTPPGVARLIAEFLEALGLPDATLVGNDTGGAFCQLVVTRHPERVGRLVLTNCDAYENFLPPAFRWLQWGGAAAGLRDAPGPRPPLGRGPAPHLRPAREEPARAGRRQVLLRPVRE
jgi:pimeloyl-ACP methyl ester carboxylesterase